MEIVSGEEEASLGLAGALNGRDGGIVDIGGASSEISVCAGGKLVYSYSLDLGVVRLCDMCGQAEKDLRRGGGKVRRGTLRGILRDRRHGDQPCGHRPGV